MGDFSRVNGLRRFDTTVDGIFAAAVGRWPDRHFIETAEGSLTYAEVDRLAGFVAHALVRSGVKSGDRVAVWMSNIWEWVVVQFAVTKIGAVLTPINTRLRKEDLRQVLSDSGAKVLFTQALTKGFSYLDVLNEFDPLRAAFPNLERVIVARPEGPLPAYCTDWDSLVKEGEAVHGSVRVQPETNVDRMAYILYTSGTSSLPKGVMLSHRNLNNCFNMLWDFRDGEKLFLGYPLFAITGCHNAVLGMALLGGCLVLQETFDAVEANELIQARSCTSIGAIFGVVKDIADASNFDRDKSPALRHVVVFPRHASQIGVYRKLGVETASVAYGLTETTGCVVYTSDLSEENMSCVGQLLPEVELKILGKDGSLVVPGEQGEIYVRGPSVMLGYFNKPEETAKSIVDGWLRTGDAGFMDTEGRLTFVSRLSDIYKCSGFNVASAEVEAFVAGHPAVAEVSVIGVPDPDRYEVGAAYVVLNPNAELTLGELQAFCRGRIASYKVPGHLRVVDALPKTASGKVRKAALKAQFENAHRDAAAG